MAYSQPVTEKQKQPDVKSHSRLVCVVSLKRFGPRGTSLKRDGFFHRRRKQGTQITTIRKQHIEVLKTCGVRPFVLYSLRHTFLTRLGASGCDVWTLARIAGHNSIQMSAKYVHPDEYAVLNAMAKLPEPMQLAQ